MPRGGVKRHGVQASRLPNPGGKRAVASVGVALASGSRHGIDGAMPSICGRFVFAEKNRLHSAFATFASFAVH